MNDTSSARRLRRSTADRKLGGVAGGLGEYLGIDPVLIRVGFVLAVFAGGAGLVAYLVAWAVMPEDDGSGPELGGPPSRDATTIAGVVLLTLAATILVNGWWWAGDLVLPVLLIGAGAWLLLREDDRSPSESPGHAPVPHDASATAPPPSDPPPPVPPPPRAAPTGPPTGRVTVGLVALLAGGFGVASAAGADPSAELVLLSCLGLTGVGLLVGAVTGRARGLIVLAVPLVVALGFVSAVDLPLSGGIGERRFAPTAVAELDDTYELAVGSLELDLRDLPTGALAGETRRVAVRVGFGEVRVLTPLDAVAEVEVTLTAGQVDLYGDRDEGTELEARGRRGPPDDRPVLEVVVDAGFGEVTVR